MAGCRRAAAARRRRRHGPRGGRALPALASALAELGLIIDGVVRDARGDWSLMLLGGTELYLGTDDIEMRFERLLAAYPQVEAIGIPIRIDLRYSNGFAVRWLPRANARAGPDRVAAIKPRERS
jgi:cell division septal protein FtsQ